MARPKVDRRSLLLRLIAALEGSDAQEAHAIKREFQEAWLPDASFYCRSVARQRRIAIDDRTVMDARAVDISVSGLAWEAVRQTLRAVEKKVRLKQEIVLSYVYEQLRWRCRDAVVEDYLPEEDHMPLEQPRASDEDETVEYREDLGSHNPLDILIAQESLTERRGSTSQPKQSFLEMLREIWPDVEKRQRFRDAHLVDSPNRLACFDQWGAEFAARPSVPERMLNHEVMAWYCRTFTADRRSYDTTKTRLRKDMARFLDAEHNH